MANLRVAWDDGAFGCAEASGLDGAEVTLKRGLAEGDPAWLTGRDVAPKTVTLTRLDETGAAIAAWTLADARPVKVVGHWPALEEVVLAHAGFRAL